MWSLLAPIVHVSQLKCIRPPKGGNKRKSFGVAASGLNSEVASAPQTPVRLAVVDSSFLELTFQPILIKSLAESLSYLHAPRPFKNPNYTKNVNRRTKNLKTVLTNERERERAERERKRAEREEAMEVDGVPGANGTASKLDILEDDEEVPTCVL